MWCGVGQDEVGQHVVVEGHANGLLKSSEINDEPVGHCHFVNGVTRDKRGGAKHRSQINDAQVSLCRSLDQQQCHDPCGMVVTRSPCIRVGFGGVLDEGGG